MYFIVNRQVEVRSHTGATFVLKPGDFFGEIALLERRPRTATVRAMTRSQLLVLDAHDFNECALAYPNVMDDLMATAQARLAGQGRSPGDAA